MFMLACSNLVAETLYAPRRDGIGINRVYPSFLIRPHDSRFRIRLLGPEKTLGHVKTCHGVGVGLCGPPSQILTVTVEIVMVMCAGCTGVQPKAITGTA